jgi:hypothetical protein
VYREREKEREKEKKTEKIKVFFQFFVKKRIPAEKIKKKAQGCGALVPWYQDSHLSAKWSASQFTVFTCIMYTSL